MLKLSQLADTSISNLKKFASDIGLNSTEFDACLDSGAMSSRVERDFQEGSSLGISSTPSFFVNNKKIEGAQSYSIFKAIIDEELQKV